MRRSRLIWLLLFLLPFVSCERDGFDVSFTLGPYGTGGEETRRVMLLYEAGFNSLSGYISSNIVTLKEGWLPGDGRNENVVLVLSHLTKNGYGRDTSPAMVRLYRKKDIVVTDTLKVWPAGTSLANAEMVNEVFNWVRDAFPAAGYGAVMSSHATGWLPEGYFDNPGRYGDSRSNGNDIWWAPRLRTFGQEYYNSGQNREEIEIHELAAAIPYRLDYILFDACLMGTVEVAWQLKDVCSYLAVSPCEIPAAGIDYSRLTQHLLGEEKPDLEAVCRDYFARYENDKNYGATITMVDCSALEELAQVCRPLFDSYRTAIRTLDGSKVQVYDRKMGNKRYYAFFDLKDVLREAGATETELASVQAALDAALVYEAHTAKFISIPLLRCCGLAMYLPSYPDYRKDSWHGSKFLDGFYKENVAWNQATMLVE